MENEFEKIKKIGLIFDTHAHYNSVEFDKNRNEVIDYISQNGVKKVCNISSSLDECCSSIELAQNFDFIYCTVGIHPENIYNLKENWLDELETLAKKNKVVAIGEIGLDYHYESFDKSKQLEVFTKQLELADKLNLPVAIHSRDAANDTIETLKKFNKITGVIHCFSGSVPIALTYLEMGFFVGITGIITFKNAKQIKETIKQIPLEKIVIETDCPYLAPEPWRGKVCNSAMLVSVIEAISQIKQISIEDVVTQTYKNGLKLYRIE